MKNCVFFDETGFNSHQTRSRGWSKVSEPAVAKIPKNKGVNISINGCISSWGIINFCKVDPLKPTDAEKIEKEFPLPDNKKKRKANVDNDAPKRKISKGTTAYHVEQTMDILDQQGKRGIYIVMDNCRIHHSGFVKDCIKNRGYKPLFMPPYSPFLNPIEECWSKIRSYTKRHPLSETDQLTPRIATACKTVSVEDCQGWVKHSITFWDRCTAKERLIF
jgi:transposase